MLGKMKKKGSTSFLIFGCQFFVSPVHIDKSQLAAHIHGSSLVERQSSILTRDVSHHKNDDVKKFSRWLLCSFGINHGRRVGAGSQGRRLHHLQVDRANREQH